MSLLEWGSEGLQVWLSLSVNPLGVDPTGFLTAHSLSAGWDHGEHSLLKLPQKGTYLPVFSLLKDLLHFLAPSQNLRRNRN